MDEHEPVWQSPSQDEAEEHIGPNEQWRRRIEADRERARAGFRGMPHELVARMGLDRWARERRARQRPPDTDSR